MENFHAIAANALIALIVATMLAATVRDTIRTRREAIRTRREAIRTRRETAAYEARKAAPEAVAARKAASDAWNAVNASRNAKGQASIAAMDAYKEARRNAIRLGAY